MEKIPVVVIGAGVVGLAVAAELSQKFSDVFVLEKENSFGQHTSSRNSEVVHAGIYYPKSSLKAKLCVQGRQLLYPFCDQYEIPYQKVGKLIVALNDDEVNDLVALEQKAIGNGVDDLLWLDKSMILEYEPELNASKALYSPSTGIIDSHLLMQRLVYLIEQREGLISYGSEVTNISRIYGGYCLQINNDEEIVAEKVVNAAGLWSDYIAKLAGLDLEKKKYTIHYCKGEYFSYNKKSFLRHLVYPVPEADIKGLGIHAVIDLAGGLKFGPSAEYMAKKIDYQVNPMHRVVFHDALRTLYPQLKEEDLSPDQAGIRPKLQASNQNFRDFVISQDLPGFINLIGIESPGLTASLAIAKQVSEYL